MSARVIELGLLGQPTLRLDGQAVRLPPGRQAGLLALLALAGGRSMSADRIATELWPTSSPTRSAVHVLVSRTRRLLGHASDALQTIGESYRLAPERYSTDLTEFRSLVAAANRVDAGREPVEMAALLDAAHLLWRGRPLEGLHGFPFADEVEITLDEERISAWEDRLYFYLRCDEPAEAVRGARELVLAHPFRERAWQVLMDALARCGRRRDALLAFQDLRRTLAAVGLEPQPETVLLERDIATAALAVPA